MYKHCLKRLIDILLSLAGILVLFLPMTAVALAIKISDPGPVLFRQTRMGIHRRPFTLYKFRSMKKNTPNLPTHLLKDPDEHLTGFGRFIRRFSIDELPQLFNILRGDMSIIGPRPALQDQDDLIAARDKYGANDIKPGLSGWAQINGRDELTLAEKARLDGEYIQRMSFLFDCKCFFTTVLRVLKGDGIVEGGTGALNKEPQSITDSMQTSAPNTHACISENNCTGDYTKNANG